MICFDIVLELFWSHCPSGFLGRHGNFERKYGNRATSLTHKVKQMTVAWLQENPTYRITDLMMFLAGELSEAEMPNEKNVRLFVKNYRQRAVQEVATGVFLVGQESE